MILKIKNTAIIASAAMFAFGLVMISPISASATSGDCSNFSGLRNGVSCGKTDDAPTELFGGNGSLFNTIINTMLFLIGALSVIMLIWGGIRYTISRGDSGEVNNAKNTILYAIVGLIVSILAFAIVNFVVAKFTEGA